MMSRKQIYQIIEKDDGSSFWSHIYDMLMLVMIVASVVPLMYWEEHPAFQWIELLTTAVFVVDYLLRWAINERNRVLAEEVVKCFVEDVEVIECGSSETKKVDGIVINCASFVRFNNKSQTKGQSLLDQAIYNGTFK